MAIPWANPNVFANDCFVYYYVYLEWRKMMNAILVTDANFVKNANNVPAPTLVQSVENALNTLYELLNGGTWNQNSLLWKGHEGSLASYCIVSIDKIGETLGPNEAVKLKRKLSRLNVEPNDNAPFWTWDKNIHNCYKRYIVSNDEKALQF